MKRGAVMHDGMTCGDCLVASVSLDGNLAISGRVSLRKRGLERETGFEPATSSLEG
jgi:hypothetical protein